MAEKTVHIGEIKKNASSRVTVTVAEYKGKPYADIRTWYLDSEASCKDDHDAWAPTKKGVAFHSVDEIDTALLLLSQARDELARRVS